jgi:hypothetical protein
MKLHIPRGSTFAQATLALGLVLLRWSPGWAADPPPPTYAPPKDVGVSKDAGAAKDAPETAAAPLFEEDPQRLPWNPDVPHANLWPYFQPVKIPTDYFGPPGEFWLRGDYLLWAFKSERLPPLVSAGPGGPTLFGGSDLDQGGFSGGRFEGGVWFDSDYTLGFQGNYFFAAEKSVHFNAASAGGPGSVNLAEPFVNTFTGQPASSPVALAGVAAGNIADQVRNDLQGGEANLVWNVRRTFPWTFDVVAGFRYLNLNGSVNLSSETTGLAGATTGTSTALQDLFSVHNHFYGGQLGGRVEYRWHHLVFDLTEKLALGGNTADIAITGFTLQTTAAGASTLTNSGLFAQPSNIGHHSDDTFAVVNELDLRAGWQFCDYFQMFVGYTFLYQSSVVRAGDVIDVGVGAPVRPAIVPRTTDFWAQGLNAGIEIRY